jgi:hypothetical protein
MTNERVTLGMLRKELPAWEWRAERYGYGWRYVGTRGDRTATVTAYGVLSGPAEDDIVTQWRVAETQETITSFWMREAPPKKRSRRFGCVKRAATGDERGSGNE